MLKSGDLQNTNSKNRVLTDVLSFLGQFSTKQRRKIKYIA